LPLALEDWVLLSTPGEQAVKKVRIRKNENNLVI
jgi:hypothetical protein